MGRSPCCSDKVNKGPWLPEESERLVEYVQKNGSGNWKILPKRAGLNRCGKSCRLRWNNYLRPDIKTGPFSEEEEETIIRLHKEHGNRWSRIAAKLPGRTDNSIKNYWNTRLKKKLLKKLEIDLKTQQHISDLNLLFDQAPPNSNFLNFVTPGSPAAFSFHSSATEIVTNFQFLQRLQNILQAMNSNPLPYVLAISQLNGLINGIKSQYIGGNFFEPQNILAGSSSPTPLLHEHLPSSSNSLHGELSNQGVPESYTVGFTNIINNSEYSLPPLVSSIAESSIVNPLESTNSYSTQAFESDIFDTLDNFLNDEANNAFLKDILG